MNDSMSHRGPDDHGLFETKSRRGDFIGLGHRRLSIIDLAGGHQPMFNDDKSVAIVFNGEIYNYQDIRQELIGKGYGFSTNSDTETVIRAYEEYGESCVDMFRGMFAFAIWDKKRDLLFLARDRFGKKPLFLFENGGTLLFASEIKAILQHHEYAFGVDHEAIPKYLVYRYVPAPRTLFQKIHKLMPGTIALLQSGELKLKRYYVPPDHADRCGSPVPRDPIGDFHRILDDAVRIRMISDVPYGAFLSGGLDSSAIVALMSRHSSFPVKTFSIGFNEREYSEIPYSRILAGSFGTEHHELIITPDHLIDELPKLVYYRDAPVSETADIPIYLLSKFARQSVKMVLTGEGSDEILAGYPKHVFERFARLFQMMPALVRKGLVGPAVNMLPYGLYRIKTAVSTLNIDPDNARLPRWFGSITDADLALLMQAIPAASGFYDEPQFAVESQDSLRRILYFDQTSWLPDNLLERGDRMTMAASLEARMPFLDHKLAEFVSSLPNRYRIRFFTTKWLLRQSMKRLLPPVILKRQKVGFRLPVNVWFQTTMKDYLIDHLTGARSLTKSYYKKAYIDQLISEHVSGRQNHEKFLWALLNLELWHKKYI